jgi:hypothetical protein
LSSAEFKARAADGILVGYEGDSIYCIWTKKGLSLSPLVTFNEYAYGLSTEQLPTPPEEVVIIPLPVLQTWPIGDSLPPGPRTVKSEGALEPENSNLDDHSEVSLHTSQDRESGTPAVPE